MAPSYIDRLQHPPSFVVDDDDVPDVRVQRTVRVPTRPETELVWDPSPVPYLEELEKLLKNPSPTELRTFKTMFKTKREEEKKALREGRQRLTHHKFRAFEKMSTLAEEKYNEEERGVVGRSVLSQLSAMRRRRLLKQLIDMFQEARDEEAKELQEIQRQTKDGPSKSEEKMQSAENKLRAKREKETEELQRKSNEEIQNKLKIEREKAKKSEEEIRRMENELQREKQKATEEAKKLQEEIRRMENELQREKQKATEEAKKLQEELRRMENELQREKQKATEEAKKLQEEIRRLGNELQTERQRVAEEAKKLQEVQTASEERIMRLEKEIRRGKWMLDEEMRKSSKALQMVEEGERELQEERQRAKEERRRELQARIMAELKINVGQSVPTVVTDILVNWLARQRFLLILKDVWEYIDLREIGVPPLTADNGGKVIIIPTSDKVHMHLPSQAIIHDKLSSLSKDEAWQLLNAEAEDAAATLPLYPNVIVAGSSILECFSYIALFPRSTGIDASYLKEFWRSEGFLDELNDQLRKTSEEKEEIVEERMEMMVKAILAQLSERCFLNSVEDKF